MTVALLALFVALGGSSYAAINITGKNVKNSSLTGADVKNNSLTGADVKNLGAGDFKRGALPMGPRGPQGVQGLQGLPGQPGQPGQPGLSAKGFSASANGTIFENEDFKLSTDSCPYAGGPSYPVVRIERKHDVAYDGSYIDSPRAPATGGAQAATGTFGTGGLVNQGDPVNDLLFPHSFNRLASGTFTVDSGGHTYSLQITLASGGSSDACLVRGVVTLGT